MWRLLIESASCSRLQLDLGIRRGGLKIGIWCDYGVTLQPSEGIGVFVANLVRGLVRIEAVDECLLISKAREEHLLSELHGLGNGKVRVAGNPRSGVLQRKVHKYLRRALRSHVAAGRPTQKTWLQYVVNRLEANGNPSQRALLESVDVWLLPYVGLDQSFPRPTVVVVHDLVTYHFPETTTPERLRRFQGLVKDVTDHATLVACMSNFILQNDLIDTLQLPREKTRMVRVAIPQDFEDPQGSATAAAESLPSQPYLLYPAAFREYKNHRYLVEALALLRARSDRPWQVVFTGISDCPDALRSQLRASSVAEHVHILGRVSRAQLANLYRHAFATVVPSLYEQGSFPLMEALHFGCPVLSSDIPSLREQLHGMGDAAIFFDPHQPADLVSKLLAFEPVRAATTERQQLGFFSMRERTWTDAAREWVEVLAEATVLSNAASKVEATNRTH